MSNVEEEVVHGVTSVPLTNATERITKKPFGIFITPENSPVQPERFRGYHTGTDFEVFDEELHEDVFVFALCAGEIISKNTINGYGGVIEQSCTIDGQEVRVLYGHISSKKTFVAPGWHVAAGEKISTLGAHESVETDGERKHLHLSIVRGGEKDLRGYVQDEDALMKWIDYKNFIEIE